MADTTFGNRRASLTISLVCDRMNVSRRTVYNWLKLGKLDWFRTPGGSVRIYEDCLVRSKEERGGSGGQTNSRNVG